MRGIKEAATLLVVQNIHFITVEQNQQIEQNIMHTQLPDTRRFANLP